MSTKLAFVLCIPLTDAEGSADLSWCVGLGSGCVENSFESTALGRPSLTSDEGMLEKMMDVESQLREQDWTEWAEPTELLVCDGKQPCIHDFEMIDERFSIVPPISYTIMMIESTVLSPESTTDREVRDSASVHFCALIAVFVLTDL